MQCPQCQQDNPPRAKFCPERGARLVLTCGQCSTELVGGRSFAWSADHALRTCYAALALQSAIRPYAEEVRGAHGMILQLRVGLNPGEVVVRTIDNDMHTEYSAVGQHTRLAASMEQLAVPSTMLLTAAILRLVDGLVRVNALGAVPAKGLTELVEVYELVGATALRLRFQAMATADAGTGRSRA